MNSRRAFSLLEMLVVTAIIGVLAGMILPAIQGLRASALRAQCASNMRQLGIAAHMYQDNFGKLPIGVSMPYARPATTPSLTDASGIPPIEMLNDLLSPIIDSPTRINSDPAHPFGPNWAVYLLPYVEQGKLYDQARVADYFLGYQTGDNNLRDRWRQVVRNEIIPIYRCPSDTHDVAFAGYSKAPGPWARGNYAANAGPGWWQMSLNGGSYLENYGRTGPVMGINYGANLPKIMDGTAATVMFTEVRSGVNEDDPRGVWAIGLPGSSMTAANAIGDCMTPNDRVEDSDDIEGCPKFWYAGIGKRDRMGCSKGFLNLGWPSWQAQSRSQHKGGVNTTFADGSVHFVSDYVAQGVWFYLLSANDGTPFTHDY